MKRLLVFIPLLLSTMAVGPCDPQRLGSTGPGASDCFGSLAVVGPRCPATFDGTAAQLPKCQDLPYVQSVYYCPAAVVVAQSGGYVGDNCYYDPSSHVLVGADTFSDIPAFCNDTSHTQSAGQIPNVAAKGNFFFLEERYFNFEGFHLQKPAQGIRAPSC